MRDYKNNKDTYSDLASVIENTLNTVSSAVGTAAREMSGAWKGKRQEYFQNLHLKRIQRGRKLLLSRRRGEP